MSSSSSLDCLELCRLCLEKERVSVPIFENEGDVRQIFLKITACLPVKVSRDDKLPKKICDDCLYKVELFYQFWNTTANAEKQLLQWLGEVGGLEDGVPEVLVSNVMKQEQASDSRLEGRVVQVGGQNSVDMGMIENMTIITMPVDGEQQFASVPMDTSGTVTVQAVASSSASANDQSQTSVSHLADEVEDDDDDDDDDGCDNEGMPVKEENEEDQSDRVLDQSSFVTIPCDEAGPSGLQQKIADISNMSLQPTEVNDPKTGLSPRSRKQNCGTKRADEVGQDQQRPLKKRICSASSSSVPTVWVKVIPDSREEWEVIGASGQKLKIPYHSGYPISKVFTCEICKAHFPSKYLLEKHRSDGHIKPGPSQPKTKSTENFDIVNYNGYQKTSTGKFTCNFCSHTALYQASMKKHVAQKHGDVGKNDVLPMDVSNSNREVAPMDSWIHRKTPPTHDDVGTWPNEMLNVIIKEEHSEVETEVARNILRNESDKLQRICPYCPYMTTMCTPFRNHVKQEHPEIWLKNNFEDLVKENVTNVESEDDESDEGNDGNDSQLEQNQEHPREVVDTETNTILIQKFKCPYCPTELTESSAMISHVACVHHKSEWKRDSDKDKGLVRTGYACYHCDFVGCNIKSLGKHGLRKHQGLDMIIGEIPVTRFDCDICSYQCEGLKTMTLHIESHKPKPNAEGVYQCKICDFDTNLIEVLGRHMSINHLKPVVPMSAEMVTCNSCEFSCINKRVMDWHQRQHELPPKEACQMVICDECGYFSYNKTRLARHITRKHRDILDGSGPATEPGNQRKTPKKYVRPVRDSIPCEICGWLAKNNSVLKYHIIRKHTDTKQYECDQCDKKYNLKADLTSHKKYKHSDTKEFVCDVCGRVCNTANGLYGHQKYAHFKTEFECQVCHRRLASQANLDEHIQKQHEERQLFMCEECGKVFHEARRLRTHMRVHTGVRPYECSVCKKSFGKQTGLRQHLLTHSGQRPYVCDVCGKAFTQKTGLICHRKSHPGPLPPLPPVPKGVIDRILNDMQAEARYLNNCQ